jgi:hypothetical protein
VHLYLKTTPNGSSTTIETNCPKGRELKVTVGTTSQKITVPKTGKFTTGLTKVAALSKSKSVKATCTPGSQGHTALTVLPLTGVTTGQHLAFGLGLLGLGMVLLRLGSRRRRGDGRAGPGRR